VNGSLADAPGAGHLALLWRLLQEGRRHAGWEVLHLTPVSLADVGRQPAAPDRAVWEAGQGEHVILLTATRNDAGPDAREAPMQHHNTPARLPVFTLANEPRVLRDRLSAAAVADWWLESWCDSDR
jgi:hypothetical protein